ncbi:MAG: right-handed parallel beta-helix repeat-containing protein, partial [Candidatus Latescibacterota bacterium]
GSLVLATGAADVVVRYAMIALNEGLPVFDCGEDASLLVEKSNFYQNDLDFAPGCAPAVIDTTHDFPYFCDPAAGDFRLFEEGGFGEAAPGGTPIGALSIGCYFPAHYVNPDSGTGVFPYETPTSATSDLEAVLDLADRGDTIRITAGKFATNLVLDGGEYLEGGWTDGSFTERDPFRSPTVLSGTLPGEPTVRFAGRFPFASTAGGLNGFVITHEPGVEGPGIVAGQGSRPVIHDCVVRDNRVDFAEAPSYPAAGIVMKGANADTQAVSNVFNNTVVNNELVGATIASAAAGGVYMQFAGFSGTDFSRFQRNIVAFNDGGRGGLVLNEDNRLITENFTFGNRNADGQAADLIVMAGFPPAARDSNQTADPMFCDPDAGEWALSTCTPAVNSATGDTVMGALPISEDCVCPNEVFLVNPLASEPGFPFRARRNAARLLSALEPYLSAGDTVKAATGAIIDEFELTGGVVYKGGYNVSTFAEATRGQGTTRIGGNSAHRVMFGGDGVDASTVVDGFTIAAGGAASGGAVLLRGDASPVFSNNRFIESRGNRAGGVLLALDESSPTIIGNLIYGNSVDDEGGIIQLEGAGGLVGQNTITDNGGGGFAIYVRDCDPEIYNNNLAYNSRGLFAAGDPATLAGIVFDHNNVFRHDLDYAPEFLAAVDTTGQGNISENPLYCGRGRRLYTLFDHSPLLGAGRGGGLIGSLYVGCSTPAHYVSSAGSDAYPYITPATAARRIQDALDVAAEAGRWSPADSTDEVRVAGGVYVDTIRVPTNVRLLGGYSPDFAARDAEDHETVIDGGGLGTVVVV